MNGENETGVTTMLIDTKVDTGDILLQEKVEIGDSMTAGELHDVLAKVGANLLTLSLTKLEESELIPITQDNSRATKAPKINNETALINFKKCASEVHNQIRGLSPYPGAYTFLNQKKIKLLKSEIVNSSEKGHPGKITFFENDNFTVGCSGSSLKIYEVQLEGKKIMSSRDFLNGYKFEKKYYF